MPTWGEILIQLQDTAKQGGGRIDFDGVRRGYLVDLNQYTHRNTILYYSNWLRGGGPMASIDLGDMQGIMEVCRGLDGPSLDVLLHSPGGSAEAAASIVRYLRQKFTDIRVFVPLAAMSAATMWALSADEIVMGRQSQLGPIDPQVISSRGAAPARAITEQFARAKAEIAANPAALGAWAPILQQYGPALLEQCEKAEMLARSLVAEWLQTYMFSAYPDAAAKAAVVSQFFADYERHHSHNLGISRAEAVAQGVNVANLEDDQELQDKVLSVHHAALHTFATPAVKIIENHLGRAFVLQQQALNLPMPMPMPFMAPPQLLLPNPALLPQQVPAPPD
jgi:hypothetical protein